MQTAIYFADRHLMHDKPAHWSWELFLKFAADFKPDVLVDGGDHIDLNYISSFDKDKLLHLEGKRLKLDFDALRGELALLRTMTKRMLFLEGNHEERLKRAIEKQPILQGMAELETNIDFKGMGIEYYPLDKQPVKIGKLHFLHGVYTNEYHAKKHIVEYGGNVVYGHLHKFQSYYKGIPLRDDEIGGNAIGCLCDKNPDWLKTPGHWQNGFAVIYFDEKGYFNVYPVIMIKKHFLFGGKVWE